MEIRSAQLSDAEVIKAFDEVAMRAASRAEFIDQAIRRDRCIVAVVDGHGVAYAVFDYSFYGRGFVSMLYVQRDYRRQGVGAALMRSLLDECATSKLFTSTNRSNTPMQGLLVKLGFEPSGVIENLDEGDPELVYAKRL